MRERILEEIKRLTQLAQGVPPGKRLFEKETGIKESVWSGVHWARWSDAIREAGFSPNEKQGRLNSDEVVASLYQVKLRIGRFPTCSEWNLARRSDRTLPNYKTLVAHLGNKDSMLRSLNEWLMAHPELERDFDLPSTPHTSQAFESVATPREGYVYLLRSGQHYKIGRSDQLERRVKEIKVALPEAAELAHSIRTDDPAGIEAYWHRRFAAARANGEWFRLSPQDVAAFKRRKFQ